MRHLGQPLGSLPVTTPLPGPRRRRRRRRPGPAWSTPPPAPAGAARGGIDANQVVAYDLAHAAAAVAVARAVLDYGAQGEVEARLACAFVADAVFDLIGRGRSAGRRAGASEPARAATAPAVRASLPRPGVPGRAWPTDRGPAPPRRRLRDGAGHLPPLRRGADPPRAPSTSTAPTATSPRRSSPGWPRWAASGCRCPRSTAGFASGGESDYLGMVVATEELLAGSLGVGGSLITRPEILTRALVKGGTEEQKQHWLPKLASAEVMVAVAVTEPDFGSDVAGVKVTATRRPAAGWVINGVKTWCTFAGPGRRADAAGPHRPRPLQGPPGPQPVHRAQAPGRRARLRLHPEARRRPAAGLSGTARGPAHRHHRLPGHALLRAGLRRLVGARRPT